MEVFEEGDLVWFLPPVESSTNGSELYYPGEVLEYHLKGNVLTIKSDEGQQFTVEPGGVRKRTLINTVGDLIALSDLSEQAVLWNVRERYNKGEIYTYVGSILLSLNPYKMYDIYGLPVVKKYEGRGMTDQLPPHLFAVGSSSYIRMCKELSAQVIVISGESGSGKTESTKLIMGYLALVNKSSSNLITEQILEASPLLESFGNAKTIRNDNSSRFGKFMTVFFQAGTPSGSSIISGGKIREYLLEKSRIVNQNVGERNYHVFYELLKGLSSEQKEKYGLLSADKYFYLNQGGVVDIQGKNDKEDFGALLSAMQILGLDKGEIDTVCRILGAVLHLGNVYFHRKSLRHGGEGVEIGSDAEIQWIGHLLEINPDGIRKCLTSRTTEARKELINTPLTIDQSLDARDAIAKILYSSLFSWLVSRVNSIVFKGASNMSIGILDIFGFEDFKENSFEQLCINYANECLHGYMSRCIFKTEQLEYTKEKLDWVNIGYEDNLSVINLLSKKPVGILHLLDDESNFPKGTDSSFLEKLHYNHALSESYLRNRISLNEFGVKHFAGNVWYNTEGFLEKNRDGVRGGVVKVLGGSANKLIGRMFHSYGLLQSKGYRNNRSSGGDRFVTMKPRAPTVSARFTDSLNDLLEGMSGCTPWFVRCIKPNNEKKAGLFDVSLVLEQMRYSGLFETIKIRKLGYPIRSSFSSFSSRYKCLLKEYSRLWSVRDVSRLILTTHGAGDFQLGSSKVFLREVLEQKLERLRYELLDASAGVIQKIVRGYLERKRFLIKIRAVIRLQAGVRGWRGRVWYGKLLKGVEGVQCKFKGEKIRGEVEILRGARGERRHINNNNGLEVNSKKSVTGVNHLEIPAELAFVLSRVGGDEIRPELVKLNNGAIVIDNYELKMGRSWNEYVKSRFNNEFRMKREPIVSPLLKGSPSVESLSLFKLILRYMNDVNLNGVRELLVQNYIVSRGILWEELREELICQIVTQTKGNEWNGERGWSLLAAVLSCIQFEEPGGLVEYVANYCEDNWFRGVVCSKIKEWNGKLGMVRLSCPGWVEMKSISKKGGGGVFIEVDGSEEVRVNSWDTVGEVGYKLGGDGGYTLEYDGDELDPGGFIFDSGVFGPEGVGFKGINFGLKLFNFSLRSSLRSVRTKSLEELDGNLNYLSNSKLNDRYYSVDNLDNYNSSEDEKIKEEELYGSITNQIKNRYVKSGRGQFKTGSSVVSGRSWMRSNMSDCSEAPSLASHVRRVRVPSQASDVDQFLDDLFSPVLSNLDDLSDVRSLVSNIKGGHSEESKRENKGNRDKVGQLGQLGQLGQQNASVLAKDQSVFIQNAMQQNYLIQQQLVQQNEALQQLLMTGSSGGGNIPPPPPLPLGTLEGHRPLIDPYTGRAKTVRIGKWRWPPLDNEGNVMDVSTSNFNEFRMRLEEKRRLDEEVEVVNNFSGVSSEVVIDDEWNRSVASPLQLVGGKKLARPFGGEVVGKLKLSNEMRAKLEMVTSVRGAKSKGDAPGHLLERGGGVKKLDTSKKQVLLEKLSGIPPPPPPPPLNIDDNEDVYNEVDFLPSNPYQFKNHRELKLGGDARGEGRVDMGRNEMRTGHRYNHSYLFKGKKLGLRKDLLLGGEGEGVLEFVRAQIRRDLGRGSARILNDENNVAEGVDLIQVAKTWQLYFWRFYRVKGPGEVAYVAIGNSGLKLVSVVGNKLIGHELNVVEFYSWSKIVTIKCEEGKNLLVTLGNGGKLVLGCVNNSAGLVERDCKLFFENVKKVDYYGDGQGSGQGGGGQGVGGMGLVRDRFRKQNKFDFDNDIIDLSKKKGNKFDVDVDYDDEEGGEGEGGEEEFQFGEGRLEGRRDLEGRLEGRRDLEGRLEGRRDLEGRLEGRSEYEVRADDSIRTV